MTGLLGSVDTGMRGLALMMAATSAISVVSTLCVNFEGPSWRNIELRILLAIPIILSHELPM